jgi:hypothetical protein
VELVGAQVLRRGGVGGPLLECGELLDRPDVRLLWVGAAPDGGITELLQVFQRDPDGDGYTLSAKALGLLATERLIQAMGAQLMVGCAGEDELALAFDLPQPTRAD